MTKVTQTSLDSYEQMRGKIGDRQKECLLALSRLKVANNRQIAEFLQRPVNVCVPRIFELRAMKLVEEDSVTVDPETKRKCINWRIK